jgi:hypothetical protein
MKHTGCHRTYDGLYFLVLSCLLLTACGEATSEEHQSALPHHRRSGPDQLSTEDLARLSTATGKSMAALRPEELKRIILRDTQGVLVLNFWKAGCDSCLELQRWLQNRLAAQQEGSCHLLAVNLDAAGSREATQLLRTAGISAAALQLAPAEPPLLPDWDDSLPALAVFEEGQLLLFVQQPSDVGELNALLQPFLL